MKVTRDTKVKAKTPLKAEDIKAGTRVVITAEEKDEAFTAKTGRNRRRDWRKVTV